MSIPPIRTPSSTFVPATNGARAIGGSRDSCGPTTWATTGTWARSSWPKRAAATSSRRPGGIILVEWKFRALFSGGVSLALSSEGQTPFFSPKVRLNEKRGLTLVLVLPLLHLRVVNLLVERLAVAE